MKTKEGNTLIAAFMGVDYDPIPKRKFTPYQAVPKYHESWDKLMPVIIKIWDRYKHSLTMNNGYAYWVNANGEQVGPDHSYGFENIQHIWEVVVEFLVYRKPLKV